LSIHAWSLRWEFGRTDRNQNSGFGRSLVMSIWKRLKGYQ
jgi:hypothetical protein